MRSTEPPSSQGDEVMEEGERGLSAQEDATEEVKTPGELHADSRSAISLSLSLSPRSLLPLPTPLHDVRSRKIDKRKSEGSDSDDTRDDEKGRWRGRFGEAGGDGDDVTSSVTRSPSTHGDSAHIINHIIEHDGFGAYQWRAYFTNCAVSMGDATEMMMLSFVGPSLECEWGISSAQEAFLTTVVFSGWMMYVLKLHIEYF